MRLMAVVSLPLGVLTGSFAHGLVAAPLKPAATSPATGPTTEPSTRPKNIEKALEAEVTVSFKKTPLDKVITSLREITQTNIAVNWPALELAGITRDTPVTLNLKNTSYEIALRAMLEQLPATKSRPNFRVAENALEITTTAELGKHAFIKIYDVASIINIAVDGEVAENQKTDHLEFLKKIVHAQLERVGEEVDAPGREITYKEKYLIVTQSQRAQIFTQRTLQMFRTPVRLNEQAPGTAQSVTAKKAQLRMTELCGKPDSALTLAAVAKDPQATAADLNVLLLPSAAAELAKLEPALDYLIDQAGLVLIGSQPDIRGRVTFAVYDLRDLIKRTAFKSKQKPAPSNAELAKSIVTQLQTKVPAGPAKDDAWGELGKSPASMNLYENLLVVSGNPALHRAVSQALSELAR